MKIKMIALCALSAAGAAAHAQTSMTIYGDIDQYLGYIHSNNGRSIVGLNDGAILRSRLGFRGVEDLGDGLQAKYNLEQGINADSGSQADSGRLFDRQAWVGLGTNSLGEFRLGRQ